MEFPGASRSLSDRIVFGASVIGPLHVRMGIPCQDACAFKLWDDGSAIIAVADGLGSATQSEAGARLAVDAVVQIASQVFTDESTRNIGLQEIVRACIEGARSSLEQKADSDRSTLCDLACTIIVVAVRGVQISVGHVGDGAVVAEMSAGLQLLSAPGASEYANEVVPLTSREWKESLRIGPNVDGVRCLAVFTDGCQRAALRRSLEKMEPFPGFFGPIFSLARELGDPNEGEEEIRSLLSSKKICENSEDDKTLVVTVLESG